MGGQLQPFDPSRGESTNGFRTAIEDLAASGGGTITTFRAGSSPNLRALGQAGAVWEGRLDVRADGSWDFDGTLSIVDTYDFDPRELGLPNSRDWWPETVTRAAAGALAGTGFSVTSVRIPARISSTNPTLTFEYNRLPTPRAPSWFEIAAGAPVTGVAATFAVPLFVPYYGFDIPHPLSRLGPL